MGSRLSLDKLPSLEGYTPVVTFVIRVSEYIISITIIAYCVTSPCLNSMLITI